MHQPIDDGDSSKEVPYRKYYFCGEPKQS